MAVHNHEPLRRWFTLWLWRHCSCGAWRVCRLPLWTPGDRIPDGDRVPWPTTGRHRVDDGKTVEIPRHSPLLTLGQFRRSSGWWAT